MPRRKKQTKKFNFDKEDVKQVCAIMTKYLEFNNDKNFLQTELGINSFFRELQADVTAHQVNQNYGTGDHGGFFFTEKKGKKIKLLNKGLREFDMTFLTGTRRVKGYYYHGKEIKKGVFPLLDELEVNEHKQTPAYQMLLTKLTSRLPFREASDLYGAMNGETPSHLMSEKVTEEVGERIAHIADKECESVLNAEREGTFKTTKTPDRLYVQMDMTAYQTSDRDEETGRTVWKMAKIGVVYDENHQKGAKESGREWKNGWRRGTTKYLGSTKEKVDDIGEKLLACALEEGMNSANEMIFLGDGARCNWNLCQMYFPNAIEILDWSHACGYISLSAAAFYGEHTKRAKRYYKEIEKYLWDGDVEKAIASIRKRYNALKSKMSVERKQKIATALSYFENNKERMRYDTYRLRGYDIGSGSVESACRQVVGKRLKDCSMKWGKRNSNGIIQIRCADLSSKIDAYWEKMLKKCA